MIRDLGHVVDREKAKIGVFITLAEPTGPMRTEAIKAGFYETEYGKFPKIQILTIAELFAGKQPQLPWRDPGASGRPRARKRPDRTACRYRRSMVLDNYAAHKYSPKPKVGDFTMRVPEWVKPAVWGAIAARLLQS